MALFLYGGYKVSLSSPEKVFLEKHEARSLVTLSELRTGKFSPEIKNIQWIHSNDSGTFLTHVESKYIINKIDDRDYANVIYDLNYFVHGKTNYKIIDLVASPNLKYALLKTNTTLIWRHSGVSFYWILDVETKVIKPLDEGTKISFVKWSPDSSKLAYVKDNNIFVAFTTDGQETIQVTLDGGENIFNGKPDWVYEEEVFESDYALWWSPNSQYIGYLKFNDTEVRNFPLEYFVQDDTSYPKLDKIKYPKAGYTNPTVGVYVFQLQLQQSNELFNNIEENYKDYLVTEVLWVGDHKLFLRTTNRVSDKLKVVIVDAASLLVTVVRQETVSTGWYEITHDTVYVPKSKDRPSDGYIDTIVLDGYNHLGYFSPITSSEPIILTRGKHEVVNGVAAFDSEANLVYYISTEYSSIDRHLYSVNLLTKQKQSLTDDSKHGYYSTSFSTDSKNVLVSYLGPGVPYQKIVSHSGHKQISKSSIAEGRNLTTNDKLTQTLKGFDLPSLEYKEIDLGEGVIANLREIKPHDFNHNKKYPLFVFVYGGPNSQLINTRFSVGILQVVASTLDAVVITVDGRGTGFKGKEYRSIVRNNLSNYETIDQLKAAKIYSQYDFIDLERTLIYGHSYGGYMTLKTLENDDENIFKYGISGAPVTDWRLYDSVYTERYMGLPESNTNYFSSAVGNHNIDNFQSKKRFLLIHGTGDDNVHIQNSFKFIDKLNLNGIQNNFDIMIFPDNNHAVNFHNGGYIMSSKILWWTKQAFEGHFDELTDFKPEAVAANVNDAKYLVF